jgi:hypothetical protein
MKILIIAEGRTGGTTLMEYLSNELTGYTSITEPYTNTENGWIENDDMLDIGWLNKFDNFIIKEIFQPKYDFTNLIRECDKVFCVYRENWYQQTKSILYAEQVGFIRDYNIEEVNKVVTDNAIFERNIKKSKEVFKNFIKENNFTNVTYEDLYYGNGIDVVKKYLNMEFVNNFPPVKRYLKNNDGSEYLSSNQKNYEDGYLNFWEYRHYKNKCEKLSIQKDVLENRCEELKKLIDFMRKKSIKLI